MASTLPLPTTVSPPEPPLPANSDAAVKTGLFRRLFKATGSCIEWCWGFFAMVVCLSIVATIPILQFVSLGYLLESSRRAARHGIFAAFPGVRMTARLGTVLLCGWLLLQPMRLLLELQRSAELLDNAEALRILEIVFVAFGLFAAWHFCWATWRGGRVRDYLWPAPMRFWRTLRTQPVYLMARDNTYDFIVQMRLPQLFWLGLRGFVVALVWLVIPISLLVLSTRLPEGPGLLVALAGSVSLATVLMYVPFAQIDFAVDDTWRSGFDIRRVRREFQRAPIAFGIAMLATLVFAVPLYLLKAELLPREAAWLPSIVFVVSIWPARVLTGWAMGRAHRHDSRRNVISRWAAFLAMLPAVIAYVGIVYLTQYISWYGAWSLYEQHAFLLPVPFVGL